MPSGPDPAAYVTLIDGQSVGNGVLHSLHLPMREPEPLPRTGIGSGGRLMDQRTAYEIYRSWGWSQVEAAWDAVHGPAPAPAPEPEPKPEPEAEI